MNYARENGRRDQQRLAVELVTADGRFVRAHRENEPDLVRAVRGGAAASGS